MNQNKNLDNELKNLTYKSYDYKNRTQLSSDWNMVGHKKTISGFEGYIYEGDLSKESDTYVCPICKKGKEFFDKL